MKLFEATDLFSGAPPPPNLGLCLGGILVFAVAFVSLSGPSTLQCEWKKGATFDGSILIYPLLGFSTLVFLPTSSTLYWQVMPHA